MMVRIVALTALLAVAAAESALAGPAASVNGVTIPYDQYVAALETTPVGQQAAGAAALERLISEQLMIQFADKEGVPATEDQVDRRIDAARKEGNLDEALKARRITLDELRREIRAQQAFINLALKVSEITDGEIRDYYFKNSEKFKQPVRVRIGAIIAREKGRIDLAAAKLKEGADFAAVAAEMSDDPVTRESGGTLGWVRPNQPGVPPSISNTALSLKVGAVSRPIKVQDQWVILKAIERRGPSATPIEEVSQSIRETIAVERVMKQSDLQKKLQEFQRAAAIEIGVERFKDLAATLKARVGTEN